MAGYIGVLEDYFDFNLRRKTKGGHSMNKIEQIMRIILYFCIISVSLIGIGLGVPYLFIVWSMMGLIF